MTIGTLLLIAVAVGAWFATNAIDSTRWAEASRSVQAGAFVIGIFGGVAPISLMILAVVEDTPVNMLIASASLAIFGLKKYRFY